MEDIDYKKLLEQDKKFKDFFDKVMIRAVLSNDNNNILIASMYQFYQNGMDEDQVFRLFKEIGRLGK